MLIVLQVVTCIGVTSKGIILSQDYVKTGQLVPKLLGETHINTDNMKHVVVHG